MERVNEGAFTNLIISVTRGVVYTLSGFHLYIDLIFYLNRLQDNTPKRVHLLQVINLH